MSDDLGMNPYEGLSYAELCGRRKDFARLKDAAQGALKSAQHHLGLIGRAMKDPRPRPGVEASDHAVVRYLERVKGMNIEALRLEMAEQVRRGSQVCSQRIRGGRFREIYVINGEGYITTVLPADALVGSIKRDITEHRTATAKMPPLREGE